MRLSLDPLLRQSVRALLRTGETSPRLHFCSRKLLCIRLPQVAFPEVGVLKRNRPEGSSSDSMRLCEKTSVPATRPGCRRESGASSANAEGRRPDPNVEDDTAIPQTADGHTARRAAEARTPTAHQLDDGCSRDGAENDDGACPEDAVASATGALLLCNELDAMWRLCKSADMSPPSRSRVGLTLSLSRTGEGLVPKEDMQAWLQTECRKLLRQTDALSLLDLVQTHTSGSDSSAEVSRRPRSSRQGRQIHVLRVFPGVSEGAVVPADQPGKSEMPSRRATFSRRS